MAAKRGVQSVTRVAIGFLLLASMSGLGGAVDVPADVSQIRGLRLANSRALARHDISGEREAWSSDIHLICCGNVVYSGASALMASYREDEFKNPAFVAYVRMPERISVSSNGTRAAEYGKWVGVFT